MGLEGMGMPIVGRVGLDPGLSVSGPLSFKALAVPTGKPSTGTVWPQRGQMTPRLALSAVTSSS
jgi:hypothetical protein